MNKALYETCLFKVVILVASIVVSVFCFTMLTALVFMLSKVFFSIPTEDIKFLVPMALATLCSGSVLACYIRTHKSRFRG